MHDSTHQIRPGFDWMASQAEPGIWMGQCTHPTEYPTKAATSAEDHVATVGMPSGVSDMPTPTPSLPGFPVVLYYVLYGEIRVLYGINPDKTDF